MDTRSRMMLDALGRAKDLTPLQQKSVGYADGGLVEETALPTAQSADPLAFLSSTPTPFTPRALRPTFGALNTDIAGLRAPRPMFGSMSPAAVSPVLPAPPLVQQPSFGSTGSSIYDFNVPVPQVRTPTAADNTANDFYTRQAALTEAIRAENSAARRRAMEATSQAQYAAKSQEDARIAESLRNISGRSGAGAAAAPVVGSPGAAAAAASTADIARLYRELLGREVDPTGLAVNKGASIDTIRKSILASDEYKKKIAGASAPVAGSPGVGADVITQLYRELLGRAPDPTGLAANQGASAETIRQSILSSPEYQARAGAGAPGGGIANIYQEMLGRAPDPTGIAANVGQSDEVIRQSIAASPEYQAQNPNIGGIEALYQELLGRAPDPTGIAANRNASEEEIRQSILNSPEYQEQNYWYNDSGGG